jgi:hypothetical protein
MTIATLRVEIEKAQLAELLEKLYGQPGNPAAFSRTFSGNLVQHVASREWLQNFQASIVGRFELNEITHLLLASGDVLALEPVEAAV